MKFKALYPVDAKSYNAILEDGTFVKLLWRGGPPETYEVWPYQVVDKRPPVESAGYTRPASAGTHRRRA